MGGGKKQQPPSKFWRVLREIQFAIRKGVKTEKKKNLVCGGDFAKLEEWPISGDVWCFFGVFRKGRKKGGTRFRFYTAEREGVGGRGVGQKKKRVTLSNAGPLGLWP